MNETQDREGDDAGTQGEEGEPTPEPRPVGRPRGSRPPLKSLVNFKGTPDYGKWLDDSAEQLGLSKAEFLDQGAKLLAKSKKLPRPPNRMGE